MPIPKPPPRTLNSEEEHKLQLFLERAAPIVLQDPSLNAERWQQLALIAGELELTADQFRSTLDDLLHRGVLQRIDVAAPKPPPLPSRGKPASDSTLPDGLLDEGFALAPPPIVAQPPPPPVQRTQPPAENPLEARTDEEPSLQPASGVGGPLPEAPVKPAPHEMNAAIPTPEPAIRPRSERSASDAQSGLALPSEKALARWRIEGEPVPIPPPPSKKPHETFTDFIRQSLAYVAGEIVAEEIEQRLLQHGTRVLGLSLAYARHLLSQVAVEKKLSLASAATEAARAAKPPTEGDQMDPRRKAFAAAAVPILAQYRGINAQSRVLLNAIAREHGLSEGEMEAAVGALVAGQVSSTRDEQQKERLTPFRDHVQATLERLPQRILPPHQLEKLVNAGVDLFGVDNELVQQTIRQIGSELKIAVVTQRQAEQYLAEMVAGILGDELWLSAEQRDRIEQAGAQWGLTALRIDDIIRLRIQDNRDSRHREETTTRLALFAASAAVLFVVCFLLYVLSGGRSPRQATKTTAQVPIGPAPTSVLESDDAWWGVRLAYAVEQARQTFPNLHAPLRDLGAKDPQRREVAYDQLVGHFLQRTHDEKERRLLLDVLSQCLARDPSGQCATRAANELVRSIPDPAAKLSVDPDELAAMFWAVRTMTAALADKSLAADRAEQLIGVLGKTLGYTLDPSQPAAQTEKVCLASLAERLFRMLISAASAQAGNVVRLHAAVATQSRVYLDSATLDKLNAEFLVAVLSASADSWRQFEDLLRATVGSTEPTAVLKLLGLYESTPNRELQTFLGTLLLARTNARSDDLTVSQVVEKVRQSLGITAPPDPNDLWRGLQRESQQAIAESTATPEQTERILGDVTRLAHYSTLACALAQNEFGSAAIAELRKVGPRAPGDEVRTTATSVDTVPEANTAPNRETLGATRDAIAVLSMRRVSPDQRLDRVASLVRLTETVPDLPPEMAVSLASYLLGNKSGTEHIRLLEHVETLAKWNQLVLAVADNVDDSLLTHEQLQSLVSRIVGHEVTLGEGKAGRVAARPHLWQMLLARLNRAPANPSTTTGPGEATATILVKLYAQQAQLLGIALKESPDQPRITSAILRSMIQEMSSRLSGSVTAAAAKRELENMTHQLAAAEYIATSELQATVLLERLWVRLLGMQVVLRNERYSAEAESIVHELAAKDRAATHVLSQLRDGQAAILRMWLLVSKQE